MNYCTSNIDEHNDFNADLNITISNLSNRDINMYDILKDSQICIGTLKSDYIELPKNLEIKPGDSINIDSVGRIYGIVESKLDDVEDLKLYLGTELYKQEVDNELKNNKLYVKCVDLGKYNFGLY